MLSHYFVNHYYILCVIDIMGGVWATHCQRTTTANQGHRRPVVVGEEERQNRRRQRRRRRRSRRRRRRIFAGKMAGMAASSRGPTGPFELSVIFLAMGGLLASRIAPMEGERRRWRGRRGGVEVGVRFETHHSVRSNQRSRPRCTYLCTELAPGREQGHRSLLFEVRDYDGVDVRGWHAVRDCLLVYHGVLPPRFDVVRKIDVVNRY